MVKATAIALPWKQLQRRNLFLFGWHSIIIRSPCQRSSYRYLTSDRPIDFYSHQRSSDRYNDDDLLLLFQPSSYRYYSSDLPIATMQSQRSTYRYLLSELPIAIVSSIFISLSSKRQLAGLSYLLERHSQEWRHRDDHALDFWTKPCLRRELQMPLSCMEVVCGNGLMLLSFDGLAHVLYRNR